MFKKKTTQQTVNSTMTPLVLTSENGPETFTALPYFSISNLIKPAVQCSLSTDLLLPNCTHISQFYKVTQNSKKQSILSWIQALLSLFLFITGHDGAMNLSFSEIYIRNKTPVVSRVRERKNIVKATPNQILNCCLLFQNHQLKNKSLSIVI